jgi:hypothetical protein
MRRTATLLLCAAACCSLFMGCQAPWNEQGVQGLEVDEMDKREIIKSIPLTCADTKGFAKMLVAEQDDDALYITLTSCAEVENGIIYQFIVLPDDKSYQFDISLDEKPTGVELVDGKPKSIPYQSVVDGSVKKDRVELSVKESLIGDFTSLTLQVFVRDKKSDEVLFELEREIT